MHHSPPQSPGWTARAAGVLLSPWSRLTLLVLLVGCAATAVALMEPQRLLASGWPPRVSDGGAVVLFAAVYGVCTAALLPRPVLNLAGGALFGSQFGLMATVAGTVLGAGIAFCLGRALGQDALRTLLRGRWLTAADRQLSDHGFRSTLVVRLVPGVPFAAANYCAAVSRMRLLPFLLATGLGCIPNTAAYVIAGSRAASPTSPEFLAATGFIVLSGVAAVLVGWRRRGRVRAA
ncbi:TVP38/TMEM64 family protein [Streptomyces zingiberis]|uniref:TVP38/TMEM64 family membrane protein n=1 Tax=Streptomyces zingiberis TaxID=2053010 RepID=A0ABX1BYM3_9ACTN|nr:TVP38/TMEM64 family protein [Streptomyces zingiberis]NJQ01580.1 TVP38/TMEM64 family protein [Streptomyces zingiberis]